MDFGTIAGIAARVNPITAPFVLAKDGMDFVGGAVDKSVNKVIEDKADKAGKAAGKAAVQGAANEAREGVNNLLKDLGLGFLSGGAVGTIAGIESVRRGNSFGKTAAVVALAVGLGVAGGMLGAKLLD